MQRKFKYALLEVRRFDVDALALGLQSDTPGVNFASAEGLPTAMAAIARQLKAPIKKAIQT